MRAGFRVIAISPRLEVLALGVASPATVPVAAPMLRGIKPEREETLTPAQAFRRHQTPTPVEVYGQLRDRSATAIVYPPSAPDWPEHRLAAIRAERPEAREQPVLGTVEVRGAGAEQPQLGTAVGE